MTETRKNLRAMVDIHHFPNGTPVVKTWPTIVPKGAVVGPDAIRASDLEHMLRNGHVVETDDDVAPPPIEEDGAGQEPAAPGPAAPPPVAHEPAAPEPVVAVVDAEEARIRPAFEAE